MQGTMTIQQQVDALTQCLWDLIFQHPEASYKSPFALHTQGRVIDGYLERELYNDGKISGIRVIAHGYLTANFVVSLGDDLNKLYNWTKFQELAFRIRHEIAVNTISVTGRLSYL